MERTPTNNLTPEDLLSESDGPPLKLGLKCNNCGKTANHKFEYALVNPNVDKCKEDGWDGVLLPRIVECKRCGAVDDYTLGASAFLKITTKMLMTAHLSKSPQNLKAHNRVIMGISQLWDGTIARRPSQAIQHLRRLAERHPDSSEAWRRLGNAQERFGQPLEAVMSWRKALEVDPGDLESTYSLAKMLAELDQWPEAFGCLREGIRLLSSARNMDPDQVQHICRALLDLLEWSLEITDEPIALMACWANNSGHETPTVTMSSVDLRKVGNWDRLTEILTSEDMISADLTAEIPEEEPTILQRRLEGNWIESTAVSRSLAREPIVNKERRIGRNTPCPCGSDKKYKKCCGR